MKTILKRDKRKSEALSLQGAARVSYFFGTCCFLTFIYSFIVAEPSALDAFTRTLESYHHEFVKSGRWFFFLGSFVFVGLGSFSVNKANHI